MITNAFYGFEIDKKIFGLVIYSDLKEGALTEIKRTQFSKLGI